MEKWDAYTQFRLENQNEDTLDRGHNLGYICLPERVH